MENAGEIEWYPDFLYDEVLPIAEASPNAWIREPVGDQWMIAERQENRIDDEAPSLTIAPGETVDFYRCERLGTILVRFNGGAHEILHAVPDRTNTFNVDFCELIAGSVEELIEQLREEEKYGGEGEYEVLCSCWSDALPHRFEIGPEGPRFVVVSA